MGTGRIGQQGEKWMGYKKREDIEPLVTGNIRQQLMG